MSDPHPETVRVLGQRWYPVVNDLIGGWSVANINKPLSEHDWKVGGDRDIADVMDEATATHIAELHNAGLNTNSDSRKP